MSHMINNNQDPTQNVLRIGGSNRTFILSWDNIKSQSEQEEEEEEEEEEGKE